VAGTSIVPCYHGGGRMAKDMIKQSGPTMNK
jgi:hypothetical protein